MEIKTNKELVAEAAQDLYFIADKIRKKRAEAGMSTYELASLAGVSPHTVKNAETGRNTNFVTLNKILRVLKGQMVVINFW